MPLLTPSRIDVTMAAPAPAPTTDPRPGRALRRMLPTDPAMPDIPVGMVLAICSPIARPASSPAVAPALVIAADSILGTTFTSPVCFSTVSLACLPAVSAAG
ncbi:Uncharacterised protein [Mycobacteroides abscessus subsp. abscessus]|nr:Uncharacterised protein [Mycobacteroides abscessus subsp. abscessus]